VRRWVQARQIEQRAGSVIGADDVASGAHALARQPIMGVCAIVASESMARVVSIVMTRTLGGALAAACPRRAGDQRPLAGEVVVLGSRHLSLRCQVEPGRIM
jgi:hypothetical protein